MYAIEKKMLEEFVKKINKLLNVSKDGGIYYHNGFMVLDVATDIGGKVNVSINRLQTYTAKNIVMRVTGDKNITQEVMDYIVNERRLLTVPHVIYSSWLYSRGKRRKTDWDGGIYFDGQNYISETPYPEVKTQATEQDVKDIESILESILGDRKTLFKKYMAQYAFENRENARPTLICYDENVRGTGKTQMYRFFLQRVFPSQAYVVEDTQKDGFNGYAENKLIFFDEAESQTLSEKYRLAKIFSGSESIEINKKGVPKYKIKLYSYLYFCANKQPLIIKENPTTDLENQWIVFKFKGKLSKNSLYLKQYNKHNGDFLPLFERAFGKWLKENLLAFYEENMLNKEIGRYGFRIPINKDMEALLDMGSVSDALSLLEIIYHANPDSNRFDNLVDTNIPELIRIFQSKGFLANALLQLNNIFPTIKPAKFRRDSAIIPNLILDQNKILRIGSATYRGVSINLRELKRGLEQTKEDLEDELFTEEDFV